MSEPTAEERVRSQYQTLYTVAMSPGDENMGVAKSLMADLLEALQEQHTAHIADVERLEEELVESVKHHAVATENNVNLGNENKRLEGEIAERARLAEQREAEEARLEAALQQAETKLAEAVELLHTLDGELTELAVTAGSRNAAVVASMSNRVVAFLARLSTVTPEDLAAHQREREASAGKTEAELREQYGLAPRCERVWRCPFRLCGCTDANHHLSVCKRHGCEWPKEGQCPG